MSVVIPVLAGPTASGKTALALKLATVRPLEIISADAMMVYRGMDIGTAKPTLQERNNIPHHLIDVRSPDESFNVADYVKRAETAIKEVLARGNQPLVVGGTGFYIRALAQGLGTVPPADMSVQAPLWERFKREGIEGLHDRLGSLSPPDATRAQRNPRRVIRALEILERTGKAPSEFPKTKPAFNYHQAILLPEMDSLEPRIEARTQEMFAAGLVEEVRTLLNAYPQLATARQAIGYKEVIAYLEGHLTLPEAKDAVTLATRQYAKRQRTWFRKQAKQVGESFVFEGLGSEVEADVEEWLIKVL